jgi:chromosome segregation ATPase
MSTTLKAARSAANSRSALEEERAQIHERLPNRREKLEELRAAVRDLPGLIGDRRAEGDDTAAEHLQQELSKAQGALGGYVAAVTRLHDRLREIEDALRDLEERAGPAEEHAASTARRLSQRAESMHAALVTLFQQDSPSALLELAVEAHDSERAAYTRRTGRSMYSDTTVARDLASKYPGLAECLQPLSLYERRLAAMEQGPGPDQPAADE